ncbi:MAG: BNR-4 repeat-containing protein [Gemmatimonadetes bacterium]|nr:BNR-4 repeat-containing protein [Gemmatimonadota bacterium]
MTKRSRSPYFVLALFAVSNAASGCALLGAGRASSGPFEIAPDGAWTWFNDERAIVLPSGNILTGYVRSDGVSAVTNFDPITGERYESPLSGPGAVEVDDHNNPSLTLLPDDRVLAVYSNHHEDTHYFWRISRDADPRGTSAWTDERLKEVGVRNTYANTYRLTAERDRIFNFHRALNFNPTLSFSTDLGQSWSDPRHFITAGSGQQRPYPRYVSNHRDRIDLIYTDAHPRNFNNSIYHLFYRDGAFRRTDGRVLKTLQDLPITHGAGETGTVVYEYSEKPWGPGDGPDDWIPGGRGWTWDVAYAADGSPVAAFQVRRGEVAGTGWKNDRIYYYYARWTGSEWEKHFVAQAGRPLYDRERDYSGGMTIDPQNPNVVYISSNALRPFDLASIDAVPLHAAERYSLYRGETRDGGRTFRWTELASSDEHDLLRPHALENPGGRTPLVWFQGTYNTYEDYRARVMGMFPR